MSEPGRFLFVLWDGAGNIPPTLAIARQLASRDHILHCLGHRSLRQRIEAAGCTFVGLRHAPEWDSRQMTTTAEEVKFLFNHILFEPLFAQEVLNELQREPPNVVVVDCMLFTALAAAESAGFPAAALLHTPYGRWFDPAAVARFSPGLPLLNDVRARLGVPPLASLPEAWHRATVALVLTPKLFDVPIADVPNNVRYVGPVFYKDPRLTRWHSPWPLDHHDPLVVVSFSTGFQNQVAALQRVLEALAELPVRVLLTLGNALGPDMLTPPPNTVVLPFVPHGEVLPHAALIVTLAGHGTVMAALAHGVPLLCLPMGRDQHFVAARVEACGAGRVIASEATPGEIKQAVVDLLNERDYREAVRRIARLISLQDSAGESIRELERLLPSGR